MNGIECFTRLRSWLRSALLVMVTLAVLLLSGCMYPDEERIEAPMNLYADVQAVQQAVDTYTLDQGKPPVTATTSAGMEEATYQTIDLRELYPRFLPEYPASSYEKGGTLIYVLMTIDGEAAVKVVDLRFQDAIKDVQQKVDNYSDRAGQPPLGEKLSDTLYVLDTAKMNLRQPTIQSVFSSRQLMYVVSEQGEVTVDYLPDLVAVLEANPTDRVADTDLSGVLAKHSFYAPVAHNAYFLAGEQIEMRAR